MKMKRAAPAIAAAALSAALLTGCGVSDSNGTPNVTTGSPASSVISATAVAATAESVNISFDSSDAYIDWKSGSYTTLDMSAGTQTITKSGVYEINGALSDGSLIIDVDKSTDEGTVILVFNNTSISSATSAPLYVKEAEKVVVILEPGTTNTLIQGSEVTVNADNEPSAALFSKADLTITGSGILNVTSEFNDGITSKDTLKITDGTLNVNAAGDGIVGKDILAVQSGNITITAGKDGLRSTNDTDAGMGSILLIDGSFNITAASDAIQAYSTLQIDGGTYTLSSGGGYSGIIKTNTDFGSGMMGNNIPHSDSGGTSSATQTSEPTINSLSTTGTASIGADDSTSDSAKCLKADGGIIINGGDITISSYEDALHTNGSIDISSGTLTVQSGDDGIHADGTVAISGGTITIQDSNEGIEGINIAVTDGVINVTSSDDGFNVNDAAGLLTIGGGTIYVNAGGDGLDSNGSIKMTGGSVTVDGPTNDGNGALDFSSFDISGGSIVATGSSGMAQVPGTGSGQASILMYYSVAQTAGTVVTLKDSGGTTVASFTPSKQFNSAAISAPGLLTGQSYTLYSNDTAIVTFTLSDNVTYLNESGITTNQGMSGMFNGGQPGFHGGGPGGQMGGAKPGFGNGG